MICSRCNAAVYCGAPCQKAHWRAHKPGCAAPAATPAQAALAAAPQVLEQESPATCSSAAEGELCAGPLSAVLPRLKRRGFCHAHLSGDAFNLPVLELLQLLPEQPVRVMLLSQRGGGRS